MATKDFSKFTTKKLNALLATASDEDKAAIQEVLDARAQASAKPAVKAPEVPAVQGKAEGQEYNDPEPLSPEEEKMLEEAEKNGGKLPESKKEKMSDDDRKKLAEELREKAVNHKCQVVPFNTAEWVDGVIVGIVEDKRSNKVLFAIKLDDGRRVVKVHDSNLIRIMDETVERTATRRSGTAREKVEKNPWTPEQMEADIAEVAVNVGKIVSYPENEGTVTGRIVSIVPDKRSQRCMYRIEIEAGTDTDPKAVRYSHKVTTLESLVIAEDFDEAGKELNTKYSERRERALAKEPVTPESRVAKCEEAYKKAEEALEKAQANLESRKKALEEAKAEYEAYLQKVASEAPVPGKPETSAEGTAIENDPLA